MELAMRRFLLLAAFLLSALWLNRPYLLDQAVAAPDLKDNLSEPIVLCLPGIYMYNPGDCAPAGPSGYLTQMAEKGFTFPPAPLPIAPTDPALSQIDLHYGEVRNQNAPVYSSVEDALKGNRKLAIQHLSGDFVYVSYTDDQEIGGKHLYMIGPNAWMTANDILRIGVMPRSQGVTLSRTPNHAFGWVISYFASAPVQTKRTPGSQVDDYTGHELSQLEIVPVYGEEKVGEETWYMIAPDEWVLQKFIARVSPDTTPPEGVPGDRWIEVNLFEQTLAVYDKRQLVFATLIASGAEPFWTQPGLFQIQKKYEQTNMRGASDSGGNAYYLEDVPWTMYYDGPRALHGAYWRAKMGFPQSHGCVNMTIGDAHWLFNWASEGDWVYVWDPSGKTPTDPKLYGSGGY
jgi:hypothetical protein